jgi:hypothetical protein
VRKDEELNQLFREVTIASAGVLPRYVQSGLYMLLMELTLNDIHSIHGALLPKRSDKPLKASITKE